MARYEFFTNGQGFSLSPLTYILHHWNLEPLVMSRPYVTILFGYHELYIVYFITLKKKKIKIPKINRHLAKKRSTFNSISEVFLTFIFFAQIKIIQNIMIIFIKNMIIYDFGELSLMLLKVDVYLFLGFSIKKN
jgi:hypothetical protein